ncbi:hypothetical protein Pcinc_025567 [Petrolisthes cinctipes]|uniref:DH domain-containing protein n=1 Tax=Petrolisthes cinctipes TaxID=88211 RepID=A0AAE1F9L3_PETCI|nr:hypothetical protein Pcinc_025567 [Petrolisthes cinctipes]
MPARDYGGSVTPAKTRRSWGDLLKFKSRPKERHLSPVGETPHAPPTMPPPPIPTAINSHNYMAEYRQKYGRYGGTVGRASYQELRVLQNVSPPPGSVNHTQLFNGHTNYAATTGTVTTSSKTTMASTVRYTDWFGSVVGRRPLVRPPLPNFNPVASGAEKTGAWDHYVTLEPVYAAPQPTPQVVPVQLYTNVCVCPDNMLNTRSKKKKKCKRCGRKMATIRQTATGGPVKMRPAIPASLYQPPPQIPNAAIQQTWGWQVLEERVYQHYEVQGRPPVTTPATANNIHTLSEEEESPPPTPETVRSVRSGRSSRSGRSTDSSHTITRDTIEPSRPAPPPPPPVSQSGLPALPPVPIQPTTVTTSAKEPAAADTVNKSNSILAENPTAYQLVTNHDSNKTQLTSDTDELSDNAVDTYDPWNASPQTQTGQVNVITIDGGFQQDNSGSKESNKIRINTTSGEAVHSTCGQSLSSRDVVVSDYDSSISSSYTSPSNSTPCTESENSSPYEGPTTKSKSSSNRSLMQNVHHEKSLSSCKLTSLNNKINASKNRNIVALGHSNVNNKKNCQVSTSTSENKKLTSAGLKKNSETVNGPRLEVKTLREASELQRGGSTVRIAGQRMLVLTPGSPQPDLSYSGFSSSGDEEEEENRGSEQDRETSIEDDTSDYPASSPTTTRASDSDTLPEEDVDLPFDPPTSNNNHYGIPSTIPIAPPLPSELCDRWEPAKDTIFEEEENEVEDQIRRCKRTPFSMIEGNEDVSDRLADEDDKDDPSASSSSTSSPLRQEDHPRPPTLSELLKVKSILKKPPSVDTSSETDSDFYLPTFSEFKRKKKQVQFRASNDVTVIEDAGESKGRKVPSTSRSHKRDREKEKERRKNNYNLIADLQDIYTRNNTVSRDNRTHMMNGYSDSSTNNSEQSVNSACSNEYQYNNILYSLDTEGKQEDVEQKNGAWTDPHSEMKDQVSDVNGEYDASVYHEEMWRECDNIKKEEEKQVYSARGQDGFSLHHGLCELQTLGESCPTSSSHQPPATKPPIRQAPPPPRGRTLSPPRPTVPPPPPPTTRPPSHTVPPPRSSPSQRPLPSPPALPLSPPLHSPPPSPSPPPPPLPTSPPPLLDDTERVPIFPSTNQESLSSQSPPFSSFKASGGSLSPPILTPPTGFAFPPPSTGFSLSSTGFPPPSTEPANPKEQLREVLPPIGHIPMFGNDEETRTATIRGRGAAHLRPSFLDTFAITEASGTTNPPSSPPQAPRRRNRNRSMSPEASSGMQPVDGQLGDGRGRRASFLSSLVGGEEHPYEQITDHIYEELLSHSPPGTARSSSSHVSPSPGKSMFDGASKYEILEYLQDARTRVANTVEEEVLQGMEDNPLEGEVELEDEEEEEEDQLGVEPPEDHFTSSLTSRNRGHRSSNMSSNSDSSENSGALRTDKERLLSGEVERTDSGVGSETSKPSVAVRRGPGVGMEGATATRDGALTSLSSDLPLCDDCDAPVDTHVTNSGVVYAPLVCRRCCRRRQERKEILTEIMETEIKYGQDLRVMLEQFYRPILVAGLLSREQLTGIFLNVEELVHHNRTFCLQLRDALEIAAEQGDEDLLTVNVARLFLQAAPMLHAFETYCVRQGSASLLLQSLEKEKELLRIFLKVSQMENTLLRRMNLHSFLMVPVQRVTKYPLLLARLYKATPPTHPSREDCRRAKEKIELHLHHMNNETKDVSPTKLWRRISLSVSNNTPLKRSPHPHHFTTNLRLRKLAMEVLDWGGSDIARVVREGRLLCLAPDSNNWTRRGRSIKMIPVQVLLVTHGTPQATLEEEVPEDGLVTPRNLGIKDAALLAFKDHKVSKAALIRNEPWMLSQCVVAWESEGETECFEITDLHSRDTYIFKGTDNANTEAWFRCIQFHALSVGMWKRRRPALANIMINGMSRSCDSEDNQLRCQIM